MGDFDQYEFDFPREGGTWRHLGKSDGARYCRNFLHFDRSGSPINLNYGKIRRVARILPILTVWASYKRDAPLRGNFMHSIRTAVSALALALVLTSSASATTFNFAPIDVPGSLGTVAQDINNAGDIVGGFSA